MNMRHYAHTLARRARRNRYAVKFPLYLRRHKRHLGRSWAMAVANDRFCMICGGEF